MTTTTITPGRYCLNLHRRYAPTWGVWECAREIFSNARDASASDFVVRAAGPDLLEIHTPTVPDLAQLFIMGCGSKDPDDDNIGQFGEGLKLAALVATRHDRGCLTLRMPGFRVGFEISDHLGEPVLHANVVEDDEPFEGYTVTLLMPGAGHVMNGKIVEGNRSYAIPKAIDVHPQIYCKGIWICTLDQKNALFSYNLNGIQLNRDRSHAEPWSIRYEVAALLLDDMDDDTADQLIQRANSWECGDCLETHSHICRDQAENALVQAFYRHNGSDAVLKTTDDAARRAREYGVKVVSVGEGLKKILMKQVTTDYQVVKSRGDELEPVTDYPDAWKPIFEMLERLAQICDVDSSVRIFRDRYGDLLGQAEKNKPVIWLNERLFDPRNEFELVRTFIHELAHVQGQGADETTKFEASLDLLATRLAMRILRP